MSEPYIKTIIADIELGMRQLLDEVTRLTDDREDCPFCTPLNKQHLGDKQ